MLEPLPETLRALQEVVSVDQPDLFDVLMGMGRTATAIVPDLVGLSLAMTEGNLTFTLVASNSGLASLDATQYLDGGPCVAAVEEGTLLETTIEDLLDESRWQLFAQSSAALGVASTLSLPIMTDGQITGGINLYAGSANAFVGHHEQLSNELGASAEGAVTNADLTFSSRLAATETPERLLAGQDIETAVGILAARYYVGIDQARQRLRSAAARAGLREALVARVVILLHSGP